jgi:hypothetical protein
MRTYLVSWLLSFALLGCGSTPYKDDFTTQVNQIDDSASVDAVYVLSSIDTETPDLRGLYSNDTSIDGANVMYAGDAGLLGMLVQVGVHSAMSQSAQSSKLAKQQSEANSKIQSLLDLNANLSINALLKSTASPFAQTPDERSMGVHIKPIFFSNDGMNSLSLKMVAWIPKGNSRKVKDEFLYNNMVHVHGRKNGHVESTTIDTEEKLKHEIKTLLSLGLDALHGDLTNKRFNAKVVPVKSYFVTSNKSKKVIRGRKVFDGCSFEVVKNLRNWLIVLPKSKDTSTCIRNQVSG